MDNDSKSYVKKQIMFSKDKDYNFIAYNILLLLKYIGCTHEGKKWNDYRKLIYLYPYVTDEKLARLLDKASNSIVRENDEISTLKEIYTRSYLLTSTLQSVLTGLEKNGYVNLSKNDIRHTLDVWINLDKISSDLLKEDLFEIEINNISLIKTTFPRVRSMTLGTILTKVYKKNEVNIWEV